MVDLPPAPADLSFAEAGRDDVAAVVALVESAFRGEESRRGWTTEADYLDGQRTDEERVAALVADPLTRVLLARVDGELVACCVLRSLEGGRARLSMLAVAPGRQGEGIGRTVLDEAGRRAAEVLGASTLELAVLSPRRELFDWYARRGFRPTGRLEPFPYGDPRSGMPRRDDLSLVVLERPLA